MKFDEEQRRCSRVKMNLPLRYHSLKDGAGVVGSASITRNVSSGGIRFRTAEFVSMACRLILELDIPMLAKPVKAISRVAWIKKNETGNDYEVGNQFLEMSKNDKELFLKYVDTLRESQTVQSTAMDGGIGINVEEILD
ncbi:MAG: PilZ domain-containing protein [Candidatus Omnitrophica bacterium]|nr:PilZ domain-containing protein [Candidatus Omnitrophota bacterium]